MRYRELREAQAPGTTFYHVTTANRLKSIMSTGLDPHRRHRRWRNHFGALLGERGINYLISDFTEAVRFAARQDYQHRVNNKSATKTIILVLHNVPTKGLMRDDNIEGQLAGHTWFKTPVLIPPADIVKVIPLTPELTKQVIAGTLPAAPPDAEEPQATPVPAQQPAA